MVEDPCMATDKYLYQTGCDRASNATTAARTCQVKINDFIPEEIIWVQTTLRRLVYKQKSWGIINRKVDLSSWVL